MDEENPIDLLAAKILEMCMISSTSKKMEVAPLWLISLLKLESMFSSFTEMVDFSNRFLYSFLSLHRIGLFILLKQRLRERNLLSLSKHVSPTLASDFNGSNDSKSISTFTRNLEIFNAYCEFSDKIIPCSSDVLNYFYKRFSDSYFGSRIEIQMLLDEFGLSHVISVSRNLKSDAKLSQVAFASILDVQEDYVSDKSDSNLSMNTVKFDNFQLSKHVCNMRFSSNLGEKKDDSSAALCLPLQETSELANTYLFTFTSDGESCDVDSSEGTSSNSDGHNEDIFSKEADCSLMEETDQDGIAITSSDFGSSRYMCSEGISSRSIVHQDHYSEEADYPLQEEIVLHGSTITASNFCPSTEMSKECVSSRLEVHNEDNFPVESAFPLKEETGPQERPSTTDFYSSTEMPNKCILSNFGRQFIISGESFKVINLIEFASHLRENEYSKERMTTSFENPEEVDFYFCDQAEFTNAKLLQNQFICAKKYATAHDLVQEEGLSDNENSKIQKDYSEDFCQTSIFGEANELLKCEFLKYLQEIIEEIAPTEAGMYLQVQEKSDFLEEHPQGENEEQHSNAKMNYSAKKTSKYDVLDNDLVQKILFSVYDFICEIEGNESFNKEMQHLFSKSQVKNEDIHSELDCVKSVRILLYFLGNIKTDLESKKDEASKLQLNLEDVRDLYSYDFKNTTEGRELQETAKKFVAEYDKLYTGIEKDLADCEWHCRNLEKVLDFYQKNCCFISIPGL